MLERILRVGPPSAFSHAGPGRARGRTGAAREIGTLRTISRIGRHVGVVFSALAVVGLAAVNASAMEKGNPEEDDGTVVLHVRDSEGNDHYYIAFGDGTWQYRRKNADGTTHTESFDPAPDDDTGGGTISIEALERAAKKHESTALTPDSWMTPLLEYFRKHGGGKGPLDGRAPIDPPPELRGGMDAEGLGGPGLHLNADPLQDQVRTQVKKGKKDDDPDADDPDPPYSWDDTTTEYPADPALVNPVPIRSPAPDVLDRLRSPPPAPATSRASGLGVAAGRSREAAVPRGIYRGPQGATVEVVGDLGAGGPTADLAAQGIIIVGGKLRDGTYVGPAGNLIVEHGIIIVGGRPQPADVLRPVGADAPRKR